MYGIDIELGDYHIGSASMDYDSQMGQYKACACEKSDQMDAGYASDKCRMVLTVWDNYGMAMYVSDEVAGREEITKPDFATAKGMVYLFDAPVQQGSGDGNEDERTKFDSLYGALHVSEDEDEDLDYSTNGLPEVSAVTIFKAPEAKPEEHGEIMGRSLGDGSGRQDSATHSKSARPIESASVPDNGHKGTSDNDAVDAGRVEEVPSEAPVLETPTKVEVEPTSTSDSQYRAPEKGQGESTGFSVTGDRGQESESQEVPGVNMSAPSSDTGSIATGISQNAEQQPQNLADEGVGAGTEAEGRTTPQLEPANAIAESHAGSSDREQSAQAAEGDDSGKQGVPPVEPVPSSPSELDVDGPMAGVQPGAAEAVSPPEEVKASQEVTADGAAQVALTSASTEGELASSLGGERGSREQGESEDDLLEEDEEEQPAGGEFSGLLKAAASIVGL